MAIESRELFSKNKIQEAICQFTFKSPIDLKDLQSFANQIISTDRYKTVEPLPFFYFNINIGNPDNKDGQTKQLNGVKISNQNQDKVIQLFTNNLSIHQIGNYESWENFREDIQYVLEKFSTFYDVEIARIDLRKINNFDFITLANMRDYLSLSLDIPTGFGNTNAISFSLEQVLEPSKTFVAIRVNYNTAQNNFILDLNYMVFADSIHLKTTEMDEIIRILDDGNIKLYKIFVSSLKENTIKHIK